MRIKRSAPVAPTQPVTNPLEKRRTRIVAAKEAEVEAIRTSDAQVVPCPMEDNVLTSIIRKAEREPRHRRPGDYLHVSDLLGKCIRKFALADRLGTPIRPNRLTVSDVITFAQGDAIHDALRGLAVAGGPRHIWGRWSCQCGYLFHEDPFTYNEVDQSDTCPHCETPTNKYHEVSMRDEELKIVGNPDLILYFPQVDAFHVTELKSITHDQWKELVRPKPDHVLQVLFYWYLMKKLGYRLTDRVSIFYQSKGYMFSGEPYKEFTFRPEEQLHRLDDYLEEARLMKLSRTNIEILPTRTACSGPTTAQAMRCECRGPCFALD